MPKPYVPTKRIDLPKVRLFLIISTTFLEIMNQDIHGLHVSERGCGLTTGGGRSHHG